MNLTQSGKKKLRAAAVKDITHTHTRGCYNYRRVWSWIKQTCPMNCNHLIIKHVDLTGLTFYLILILSYKNKHFKSEFTHMLTLSTLWHQTVASQRLLCSSFQNLPDICWGQRPQSICHHHSVKTKHECMMVTNPNSWKTTPYYCKCSYIDIEKKKRIERNCLAQITVSTSVGLNNRGVLPFTASPRQLLSPTFMESPLRHHVISELSPTSSGGCQCYVSDPLG